MKPNAPPLPAFCIILMVCAAGCQQVSPEETACVDFMLQKGTPTPGFYMEDAYKWLYQAACGGAHALHSLPLAKQALFAEWQAVCNEKISPNSPQIPPAPLFEPLRPDGAIGRLHFRPFAAANGQPLPLWTAFSQSAARSIPDLPKFIRMWRLLGKKLRRNPAQNLRFSDWKSLDNQTRPKHYPPIHHSPAFRAANHPAYRLLTATEARALLAPQTSPPSTH